MSADACMAAWHRKRKADEAVRQHTRLHGFQSRGGGGGGEAVTQSIRDENLAQLIEMTALFYSSIQKEVGEATIKADCADRERAIFDKAKKSAATMLNDYERLVGKLYDTSSSREPSTLTGAARPPGHRRQHCCPPTRTPTGQSSTGCASMARSLFCTSRHCEWRLCKPT